MIIDIHLGQIFHSNITTITNIFRINFEKSTHGHPKSLISNIFQQLQIQNPDFGPFTGFVPFTVACVIHRPKIFSSLKIKKVHMKYPPLHAPHAVLPTSIEPAFEKDATRLTSSKNTRTQTWRGAEVGVHTVPLQTTYLSHVFVDMFVMRGWCGWSTRLFHQPTEKGVVRCKGRRLVRRQKHIAIFFKLKKKKCTRGMTWERVRSMMVTMIKTVEVAVVAAFSTGFRWTRGQVCFFVRKGIDCGTMSWGQYFSAFSRCRFLSLMR